MKQYYIKTTADKAANTTRIITTSSIAIARSLLTGPFGTYPKVVSVVACKMTFFWYLAFWENIGFSCYLV